MIAPTKSSSPAEAWADRGWYLAVEYGVLARERFLKRLGDIRKLGAFKELLEEGGAILYRNLFREHQVKEAWDLLTLLRPWHDRLVCTLSGQRIPLKAAQDVLWCAAFLSKDRPCRAPEGKKDRPAGCEGARVLLGVGQWALEDPGRRHALTFSSVDDTGTLRFDRAAIAEYASSSELARRCPAAPGRDPIAFAAAFEAVSVRALGWPLVAVFSPELKRRLGGGRVLEEEYGFILKKGEPDLEPHAALDLGLERGKLTIRRAGERGKSLASEVRLPASVRRVLGEGTPLRAVRMQEVYVRRKGGHYELEQRFVITQRVHLLATDRPATFAGYTLATFPRATSEYAAWADRVAEALP